MRKYVILFLTVFFASQVALAFPLLQEKRKPKRVKRPTIESRDSVFFKNVFEEALVGDRPARATANDIAARKKATKSGSGSSAGSPGTSSAPSGSGWSRLISAEALQTELKSLSNAMNQSVTSPGKFKSGGNREVRTTASMIALVFAVINEYDGDIKWKDIAAGARDAFAQCAHSSSTTSTQAYAQAKNRKEDLQQILSGGPFTPPVKPADDFEWASVADLSELMKRIKLSYRERIKPWVGSEQSYKSNFDELMQEAAMMAVVGEVLTKESMENAENDDYVEFAHELRDGALMILQSASAKDQGMAAKGAGMMDQSCQKCHGEYN